MNSAPQRKDPHLFRTDESSGYIIVPLNTYSVNEGTEEMLDVQTGVEGLVKVGGKEQRGQGRLGLRLRPGWGTHQRDPSR